MNMRVGTVVLNFNNYEATLDCVRGAAAQSGTVGTEVLEHFIVIVDNGSENDSCARLTNALQIDSGDSCKYENATVKLIRYGENLGFAGGMNLGIQFLRDMGIKFIFLANSDLVFTDEHTYECMLNRYIAYCSNEASSLPVGIINPTIRNRSGKSECCAHFKKRHLELRMLKTYVPILDKMKKAVLAVNKSAENIRTVSEIKEKEVDRGAYTVCGSGYMLTEKFFEHYKGLYPETFLYGEEYALILYLNRAGLYSMQVRTPFILHAHQASTPSGASMSRELKRKIQKHGHHIIIRLMFMNEEAIVKKYG